MQVSAGIALFRIRVEIEMLIGHPGGPLWARRDKGSWSIPKGLVEAGEEPFEAAVREFTEETGFSLGAGPVIPLGTVTQRSGKRVTAWAVRGDADPMALSSNPVEMTWPRGSGRRISFPELDRVIWAGPEEARLKLNQAQADFVRRLHEKLAG